MNLPTKNEARALIQEYVTDPYQLLHAEMVGRAVEGYAEAKGADSHLWWLTGYLHDIDYQRHPDQHPGPSLTWFKDWHYPAELIDAVEAHADGFNGFNKVPETELEKTLMACDEICGIFYAYQKLNPVPYGDMKASSIKKRLQDQRFAPGISRPHILTATDRLGLTIDEHIANLIEFLKAVDQLPAAEKQS